MSEKKKKNINRPGEQEAVSYEASQTSIAIGRNAKGQPTFEIKVYDFDPDAAEEKAFEIFKRLNKKLPFEG